jgi:hypothetical protein
MGSTNLSVLENEVLRGLIDLESEELTVAEKFALRSFTICSLH